jgi:DNA-binding Lrp family transcriptional regulator
VNNPNWNDDEIENYRRLIKTGNGKDPEGIHGLAYTAVCEMRSSRVEREKNEKFRKVITEAMLEVFDGMCFIEEKLGVSLREMSDKYFKDKMERARKQTNAICEVLYAMRREYVDMTTAHGPMGDHVGTCRTIKVEALEDFIGRMCKAIGLEWKDVVSYAEEANAKA